MTCWPKGMESARSPAIWAGDGTPCSATPAPPPGRNWSTGAGRHRAPASWTRLSPTCTSAQIGGCGNAAQLFREIRALGYPGSYSTVRDYLDQHRPAKAPLAPPPPAVREVTGWLTRHPENLTEDERPQLKALLGRCPELQAAAGHVRTFATMLTQLTGQNLPQWISGARAADLPGISSFAKGLEQDLDAVTQGLTTRWNSGPVEGRVNHIKMIKRQMFGRAGLPLLRKRVLLTAQHQ